MIQLIAISGSLRYNSSNTRLIKRITEIAGDIATIDIFTDLHQLPHFNPDNEPSDDVFVGELTQRMRVADGLIISTPEYAHGVPGSLKNALDWLVSSDAFINKPFALYHACDRSIHAPQSLIEILKTMSGIHITLADVTIDMRTTTDTSDDILQTPTSINKIKTSLTILSKIIQ